MSDREDFIARFVTEMVRYAGPLFETGESVADYARGTALSYWDDEDQRADGPEACAEADMSCWGEDD